MLASQIRNPQETPMRALLSACLLSTAALAVAAHVAAAPAAAPTPAAVLTSYGDVAHAMYEDSLKSARTMQAAINAFLANPNTATLTAARNAWKAARVPYLQTEGLRFGNAIVDEWEPKVNAWPLDEGLIDYVDSSYGTTSDENPLYTLNVIANRQIRIGARQVNASVINANLLREIQMAQGVEANVATGYHAIEFMLWGQDLHGTGPGAGERPATDYSTTACTHGNCDRRAAYLRTATELLIADLTEMTAAWAPGGAARMELSAKGANGGLATILTGLGSLSYGELAGERMKLGLILRDPEEEQDCFSDNTHNSHYYDQVGMMNLWRARYVRTDGTVVQGASLRDHVVSRNTAAARRLDEGMDHSLAMLKVIKDTADSGRMAYDQMIGDNEAGNKMVQDAVDALVAQTRATEAVVATLGLTIALEGSDSLDNPSVVQ
jgi:putative iron-regulated protein